MNRNDTVGQLYEKKNYKGDELNLIYYKKNLIQHKN